MKVFKYSIPVDDIFTIDMPQGAIPLCVKTQRGAPCLWAAVDPLKPYVTHKFTLCGTGQQRDDITVEPYSVFDEYGNLRHVKRGYIGSFQMMEESLIFHVFDEGE